MEDKQKIYRAVILDGIAEIYSNVKYLRVLPVNFNEVTEIKSDSKINLIFSVEDLPVSMVIQIAVIITAALTMVI